MNKRVAYICSHCGGNAVLTDAWAEWDVDQQSWTLQDTVTEAFCRQCDGETSLIEVELAPSF